MYMSNTFFGKNLKNLCNILSSNRAGKQVRDCIVTDLKEIRCSNEEVSYKLLHSGSGWTPLLTLNSSNAKLLDIESIPFLISWKKQKKKFQHLQHLKNSLKQSFHSFMTIFLTWISFVNIIINRGGRRNKSIEGRMKGSHNSLRCFGAQEVRVVKVGCPAQFTHVEMKLGF